MSQIKFEKPLQLNLIFSQQHKIFLYCSHIVAGFLLFPLDLHLGIKILLTIYVVFSLYRMVKAAGFGYTGVLGYMDENNWLWIKQDVVRLQLQHGFSLLPQLVLLNFVDEKNRKYNCLLFPDSIDKETFRKVRIIIRHSTAETMSPPV